MTNCQILRFESCQSDRKQLTKYIYIICLPYYTTSHSQCGFHSDTGSKRHRGAAPSAHTVNFFSIILALCLIVDNFLRLSELSNHNQATLLVINMDEMQLVRLFHIKVPIIFNAFVARHKKSSDPISDYCR